MGDGFFIGPVKFHSKLAFGTVFTGFEDFEVGFAGGKEEQNRQEIKEFFHSISD